MVPTACTKYILRVMVVDWKPSSEDRTAVIQTQLSKRGTFILGQNNKEGLNLL